MHRTGGNQAVCAGATALARRIRFAGLGSRRIVFRCLYSNALRERKLLLILGVLLPQLRFM